MVKKAVITPPMNSSMISKVSEQDWEATRNRIGQWDGFRLHHETDNK